MGATNWECVTYLTMIAPYFSNSKVAMFPTGDSFIKPSSVEGVRHPEPDEISSDMVEEWQSNDW